MNQLSSNTIDWEVLRSDLGTLEKDCEDKGIPWMHTWRYQHSTFPYPKAYKQASDTIQLPTGYRWNMDFANGGLNLVCWNS